MLALLQSEHGAQHKMKTHSIILSNFSQEKYTLFYKIGRLETVLFSDCIKKHFHFLKDTVKLSSGHLNYVASVN